MYLFQGEILLVGGQGGCSRWQDKPFFAHQFNLIVKNVSIYFKRVYQEIRGDSRTQYKTMRCSGHCVGNDAAKLGICHSQLSSSHLNNQQQIQVESKAHGGLFPEDNLKLSLWGVALLKILRMNFIFNWAEMAKIIQLWGMSVKDIQQRFIVYRNWWYRCIQNIIKNMSLKKSMKERPKHNEIEIIEISSDSEDQKVVEMAKKTQRKGQKKQVSKVNSYSLIPQIPEIALSKEQMNGDPIQLLMKLQKQYQEYGAVKLVTPPEWKPPFSFRYSDKGITTRIQHLHKLKFGKSFKERQQAYNIKSFTNFAQEFERNYRFRCQPQGKTNQDKEQQQYWELVNGNNQGPQWKFKTTIEYAADLPVGKHGSGFPLSKSFKTTDENFQYHNNFFNLNNTFKSPHSLLRMAEEKKQLISGVITPWVYMGMMFSTFCWHVQDLWLNSLNYSHQGATKTWYIVPRKDKEKFDSYVAKKTGKKDLLNRITYMIDPLEIKAQGITVHKANQRPGQFICTFFKAYHSGFSHGFNVGEAVNFISPKSLSMIRDAELFMFKKSNKPSVLPYDWLIYANKQNSFGEYDSLMQYEYERILAQQYSYIDKFSRHYGLRMGTEISDGAKYDKNSCSVCRNYQYLSSIRCEDCNKNYCERDVKLCCNGRFELVFRKLNEDRLKILRLLSK